MQTTLLSTLSGRKVRPNPNLNVTNCCFLYIEDGTNVDNWTVDELKQCVRDYYVYCA